MGKKTKKHVETKVVQNVKVAQETSLAKVKKNNDSNHGSSKNKWFKWRTNKHDSLKGYMGMSKFSKFMTSLFTTLLAILGVIELTDWIPGTINESWKIVSTLLCTGFTFLHIYSFLRCSFIQAKSVEPNDRMSKTFEFLSDVLYNILPSFFIQLLYLMNIMPKLDNINSALQIPFINDQNVINFVIAFTIIMVVMLLIISEMPESKRLKDGILFRIVSIIASFGYIALMVYLSLATMASLAYALSFLIVVVVCYICYDIASRK